MLFRSVEYKTKQNQYQEKLANYLFEHGADILLGGHSHVPQPMEIRTLPDGRQGFVCYSLGNFISSQTKPNTNVSKLFEKRLSDEFEIG